MAITIRDLAQHLKLSKSTVSYALNGGPKPVSESVKSRVEAAAQELGYRRNEIARSLAVGRTHTIGFVPYSVRKQTLHSWFERTVLEAICEAADAKGLHLLLPSANASTGKAGMSDPHFASRVDGVVLLAPPDDSELPIYLSSRSIPIAIVAGNHSTVGPCFNAENVSGTGAVVDHLYELGHRKIAIVTHPDHADVLLRQNAFFERMGALGLKVPDEYVGTTDLHMAGGYEAAQRLLTLKNRPSAVFCVNDPTALGFIYAARELGLRVPEDVSVAGFDNDSTSTTISPSITTVHQPVAEMAVAAFESVVDQIDGKATTGRTFPTQLIVRASTCPVED